MNRLLVLAIALAPACGPSLTPQERTLTRVFADSRRDPAGFAAHFDPKMSSDEVRSLRETFAGEKPPKFEQGHGPVCVRAYWGEYVIDHGYYFYLRAVDGGFVITDVERDTGFGPAFASFGWSEDRDREPTESELDRCTAANAAAARR